MTRDAISSNRLAPSSAPLAAAIRSDGTIYVSGQIAVDPSTGSLIDGDVRAQTEQVFANLVVVLEAAGKTLFDVVRAGVYLTDMGDFSTMNEVYARYFSAPYPARTCIGVAALPLGARVEIDLIVHYRRQTAAAL